MNDFKAVVKLLWIIWINTFTLISKPAGKDEDSDGSLCVFGWLGEMSVFITEAMDTTNPRENLRPL